MDHMRALDRDFMEKNLDCFLNLEEQFKQRNYEAWGKENFLLDLPKKWSLSRVSVRDTEIAGYLIISSKNGRRAYIHKALVSPDYQNSGTFSAMMKTIMKDLVLEGYLTIAWSCPLRNKKLIRQYTKISIRKIPFTSSEGEEFYMFERNLLM
jgi:ribosomal protein S18 acetylase RimI-like enzyme